MTAPRSVRDLSEQTALRDAVRAYVMDCLRLGLAVQSIEDPLGMAAECRRVFGPSASIASVAGVGWLRDQVDEHGFMRRLPVCARCAVGDHSGHRESLGGICVGCPCPAR